jgi:hypothetical protein
VRETGLGGTTGEFATSDDPDLERSMTTRMQIRALLFSTAFFISSAAHA